MVRIWIWLMAACCWAGALAADGPALPWSPSPPAAVAYARAEAIAALGRLLFFDPALSASGRMACATCHDPASGFAAPDARPVRFGGADLRQPGVRAVPGLTYGSAVPAFREHGDEVEDEGVDQGPAGGLDWDGRVNRARDQAALPLLQANEMANARAEAVVAAAERAAYAETMRGLFGATIFREPARAFAAICQALEYFQQTAAIFSPFSSKYDAVLRGRVRLNEQEARGQAVFDDPAKGNCAQCHRSAVGADGRPPLFTDFGFAALGLPRNPDIPANRQAAYFDLGLCGPLRRDLADRTRYCGMFRTPTLRNVALKKSFYHNGVFHSLRDAVAFYALRDVAPAEETLSDLPDAYRGNVERGAPFGVRRVLSDADVDDLVAFLETLTDGYSAAP
jgi:cytochrome c peroxidase